ncbi:MAG: HAMP domain-containing histidine kinase [Deltaproteobacteria bacterium]|nr:HAMP domain-containing histidine kinase [Deltaproteobacteria bacterium]MBW2018994.1 HAMP domain-containing histidine kinase [Deltaproteobacteria bacterium]MBW2073584.1 HAMP domain-containing histidine kinase [Deltaproteobacteria bacterium]RLB82701.1 MAG: hypothetical protein DRH17_04885 [Deltaproteobacteria bacterium]
MIDNALYFLGKTGGEIVLTAQNLGQGVRIRVSDNGPGMKATVKERVFDPFFTTKPVGEGTGLGLAICYGIVKKLGGEIHVESEEGKGTAFTIQLPFASPERRTENETEDLIGR